MDEIVNKVGSYWFSRKANKEINSVGDDINSLSSSIEGGTKWLVNKLKEELELASLPHRRWKRPVEGWIRDKETNSFPVRKLSYGRLIS